MPKDTEIRYELGMYVTCTRANFASFVFVIIGMQPMGGVVECRDLEHGASTHLHVNSLRPYPIQTGDVFKSHATKSNKLFFVGLIAYDKDRIKIKGVVGNSYSSVKTKIANKDFDIMVQPKNLLKGVLTNY